MKPKIKLPAVKPPTVSARAALLVASVLAAAAVAWQGVGWYQDKQDDDRRDAAVAVARDQVLDLTTLDSETIDDKLAAMAKRLGGDFKRQFDGFAETFAEVVNDDNIRATGEVEAVAVDQYDGNNAVVLVATTAEVAHGKSDEATEKSYRMRVELDRSGDRWLITGMEFVA